MGLRPANYPNANPPTARIGSNRLTPIARMIWIPVATMTGSDSKARAVDFERSAARASI
jgi:hypothetical protein